MSEPAPAIKKPFACSSCGMVIGFMVRSARVTKLHVFSQAIPACMAGIDDPVNGYIPAPIEILVVLESGIVHCSACGKSRPWSISQEAFDRLIERRLARSFGLKDGNHGK